MNLAQRALLVLLRAYQLCISPALTVVFGPTGGCRYTPTCSCYARDAVKACGAIRGSWLAAKRVCRCHPWGGSGEDPIPQNLNFPVSNLKSPAA